MSFLYPAKITFFLILNLLIKKSTSSFAFKSLSFALLSPIIKRIASGRSFKIFSKAYIKSTMPFSLTILPMKQITLAFESIPNSFLFSNQLSLLLFILNLLISTPLPIKIILSISIILL